MTDEVNGDKEERMKVLIADDEPLAVERLSRLVTQRAFVTFSDPNGS